MEKMTFPSYFDVDDILVKVDYDSDSEEVFGMTAGGKPYSPIKAEFEGTKVTEKEFNDRVNQIANPSDSAASA